MTAFTHDLVVIGAGPAGMSAALTAASCGLKTLLLDEQLRAGGQIYRNITAVPPSVAALLGPDYIDTERHWPRAEPDQVLQPVRHGALPRTNVRPHRDPDPRNELGKKPVYVRACRRSGAPRESAPAGSSPGIKARSSRFGTKRGA